jgi:hypothetical protein
MSETAKWPNPASLAAQSRRIETLEDAKAAFRRRYLEMKRLGVKPFA